MTKERLMTNKELADRLESDYARAFDEAAREAALRLRELPDTTPPPKSDEERMRELVEKHGCVFEGTLTFVPHTNDQGDTTSLFWWRLTDSYINHKAAMTIIRNIAKEKCEDWGYGWYWGRSRISPRNKWVCWTNGCRSDHPDELSAIDALLTAMGN